MHLCLFIFIIYLLDALKDTECMQYRKIYKIFVTNYGFQYLDDQPNL